MSEAVLEAAESSVAKMIGESFGGVVPSETEPTVVEAVDPKEMQFDFDAEFQTRIAAFTVRDNEFFKHVGHLLKPEFFENAGEAVLVNLVLNHTAKYHGVLPDEVTMKDILKDAIAKKVIRGEAAKEVLLAYKDIRANVLINREYAEEKVARFARHQAMGNAIMASVNLRERGEFDKIEYLIKEAMGFGVSDEAEGYDYMKRIDERTAERLETVAGKRVPKGITTGIPEMDRLLYHRGWGRKELATIMGGAKAGKTTALINFAKSASMAGHNVLYVTLEVGKSVIGDRLDACISETLMKELTSNIHGIREKIEKVAATAGALIIHEYGSGTLSNAMLRKLIDRYKVSGRNSDGTERKPIKFDLLVVDYADIMMANHRTDDAIENSKSVYIDLRAIAFDEDLAALTATQTNRAGFVAAVAKAEHVAEDFNKVRTVDLMISINKTEEEAKRNEARLYFAASRNQESGFTILIKQNMAMMKFVDAVLGVE